MYRDQLLDLFAQFAQLLDCPCAGGRAQAEAQFMQRRRSFVQPGLCWLRQKISGQPDQKQYAGKHQSGSHAQWQALAVEPLDR